MDPASSDSGMITLPSAYSAAETVDRLAAIVEQKGNKVFLRIDQQAEAAAVGLRLRPTQLLLFGNPRAGTMVMQAAPTSAVDLPLKALAWEDEGGQTWVSYNSPAYLQQRHHLAEEIVQQISGIGALIDAARM
jgi:uncharacterized protein (DUF302 family)